MYKLVNCMIYELYFNKDVFEKQWRISAVLPLHLQTAFLSFRGHLWRGSFLTKDLRLMSSCPSSLEMTQRDEGNACRDSARWPQLETKDSFFLPGFCQYQESFLFASYEMDLTCRKYSLTILLLYHDQLLSKVCIIYFSNALSQHVNWLSSLLAFFLNGRASLFMW